MRTNRLALLGLLAVLALCAGPHARAQSVSASQVLTISATTASTLTGISGASFCRGVLEGGNIRLALDGSTASATVGRPVLVGERVHLNNPQDIGHFSAFALTPTTTTIAMYCGSGTAPAISVIESPPTSTALPLCNALTRPAGNCR